VTQDDASPRVLLSHFSGRVVFALAPLPCVLCVYGAAEVPMGCAGSHLAQASDEAIALPKQPTALPADGNADLVVPFDPEVLTVRYLGRRRTLRFSDGSSRLLRVTPTCFKVCRATASRRVLGSAETTDSTWHAACAPHSRRR
jgi:hypothetical protein